MAHATSESAESKPLRSNNRRWLKLAAIVIAAVVVLVWLAFWLYHRMTHVSENDARVASHEITVSSRLPGRVTGFDLIEGDRLAEGDTVAQLYSRPDQLELERMQAQVEHIKTQLSLANQQISGGVDSAQAMLAADRAAVQAAKARMGKAHDNYVRAQNLYEAKGGTEKQRDIYRFDYQSAKAEYQRAQSQVQQDEVAVTNARTGLLSAGQITNPDVLKSQLKIARARLAHQQNMIDDLRVASPIHGVVDRTFIEQAEYISAGQPILMMHDPNDVWIEANIKETEVADLAVGQPVDVHVDARPDTTYKGHVQVIGGAATNQFALLPDPNPSGNFTKITQRIPVRIAIDQGPKPKLSPGMMVEVDINITAPGKPNARQQQTPIKTRDEQVAPPADAGASSPSREDRLGQTHTSDDAADDTSALAQSPAATLVARTDTRH
ncbi:HlyD family secretion protein [Salinisphaera sp. Q1T1-3]|uniref:HlyD family secretion protein n=1 Tax=Salinisphaera sp. Q1T1-3 TaxID=2321229 RepID=UPI000E72D8F3|nr:HlyD family secretion protein [Salinisphaera sp. Q1T1-3]RJS91480.1 HlyD family secretion protein [Salinisphaera sp. Q1T1-3]